MDARLDTLTTKMYQVNTHVSRIARCQASMGGFITASPSPPTSEDADDDGDAYEDDDASSSSTNEMST